MNEKRKLTAVPAQRMSPGAYKWTRRAVIGAIMFAALLGPLAFVVASNASNQTYVPPPTTPQPVIGMAQTAALEWLAGSCTSVPTAADVDPCFGRTEAEQGRPVPLTAFSLYRTDRVPVRLTADTVDTAYVVTFQVVSEGRLFRLAMTMRTTQLTATGSQLPVLASAPALLPAKVAPPGKAAAADYGSNQLAVAPSPALQGKADLWAQAYAAGDSDALRLVVAGGPDGIYPGLGGLTVERVSLGPTVLRTDGASYARVKVVFVGSSANEWNSNNEFDLLILDTDSPDPRVVAWGPAGSGSSLEPYENNLAAS